MKNSSQSPLLFGALTTLLSFAGQATAAVVLEIDISNPAAVVFSATSGTSSTDSTLRRTYDGFTIENFFTTEVTYSNLSDSTGDLVDQLGIGPSYSGFGTFEYSDNVGDFKAANDLSIFTNEGDAVPNQVFAVGSVAFTGSETYDFSSTPAALPSPGATGNVISGYFQSGTADHGEVIGQWVVVVPEPSAAVLGVLGMLMLVKRKR
ncbi:hypothetical protein V2O64_14365 [Verrucomicrobiaceae bacterium 227]